MNSVQQPRAENHGTFAICEYRIKEPDCFLQGSFENAKTPRYRGSAQST